MELKDWIARTAVQLDPLTLLLWLVTVLIVFAVGMAFGRRAQRRRERQSEVRHVIPDNADQVPIARWIEEGKQLFNLWQEAIFSYVSVLSLVLVAVSVAVLVIVRRLFGGTQEVGF